jgi:hypothetical protein
MRVDEDYLRSLITKIDFVVSYKDGKPVSMTALAEIADGAFHISATSGTIIPERFDRCIGEKIATDAVVDQLYKLEGYLAKRILVKANAMSVKLETDGKTPDAVLELILTALLETK